MEILFLWNHKLHIKMSKNPKVSLMLMSMEKPIVKLALSMHELTKGIKTTFIHPWTNACLNNILVQTDEYFQISFLPIKQKKLHFRILAKQMSWSVKF